MPCNATRSSSAMPLVAPKRDSHTPGLIGLPKGRSEAALAFWRIGVDQHPVRPIAPMHLSSSKAVGGRESGFSQSEAGDVRRRCMMSDHPTQRANRAECRLVACDYHVERVIAQPGQTYYLRPGLPMPASRSIP